MRLADTSNHSRLSGTRPDYQTSAQGDSRPAAPSALVRRVLEAIAAPVTTHTPIVESVRGPRVDARRRPTLIASQLSGPSSLVPRYVAPGVEHGVDHPWQVSGVMMVGA